MTSGQEAPGAAAAPDPQQAAIIRRMRRLVMVSTAIMALGFLAVMSAIAYRLVKTPAPAPIEEIVHRTLPAPAGTRILSISAEGGHLFILAEPPGAPAAIHVLDAATLRPRGLIEPPRP